MTLRKGARQQNSQHYLLIFDFFFTSCQPDGHWLRYQLNLGARLLIFFCPAKTKG